jgi:hypothetical protein
MLSPALPRERRVNAMKTIDEATVRELDEMAGQIIESATELIAIHRRVLRNARRREVRKRLTRDGRATSPGTESSAVGLTPTIS